MINSVAAPFAKGQNFALFKAFADDKLLKACKAEVIFKREANFIGMLITSIFFSNNVFKSLSPQFP